MNIKDQVNADVKEAMLAGDKQRATVLRGIKSVILNEEVAQGKRENGLDEVTITSLLQKEVKKRSESIELYEQANETERAAQERYEAEVIAGYLPEMMDEAEVSVIVDEVVSELDEKNMSKMGHAIGAVKQRTEGRADGALIARLVKEKLS